MKSAILFLTAGLFSLTLSSCVDLGPGLYPPGGGGGYGGGGYGGGYGGASRGRDYDGGYARPRAVYPDRDDRYREDPHRHDSDHHSSGGSGGYYGGPDAWYHSGEALGRQDRQRHLSKNYRRHSSQYDGRTEGQFARGYNAGYH